MKVSGATFAGSSVRVSQKPSRKLPEFAFIGRSNVGKSSLINMLTGNSRLAMTSATPGKTRLINHFLINDTWYLVDLPGYGFAKTAKSQREKWMKMIQNYMLHRQQLVNVFVLIDSRIAPQAIDIDFIRFLGTNGIPLSIVFTKIDKEKQREINGNIAAFKEKMSEEWDELPYMILTSSVKGYGRDTLLNYIEQINETL